MCVCLCVGLCTCEHAMRVCGHIGCWCVSVSAHLSKSSRSSGRLFVNSETAS